jgi:hypothetical protein
MASDLSAEGRLVNHMHTQACCTPTSPASSRGGIESRSGSNTCAKIRTKTLEILRTLGSLPSCASAVKHVLLGAFASLCEAKTGAADGHDEDMRHAENHARPCGSNVDQSAQTGAARKTLVWNASACQQALAATLLLGGALDTLFLRGNSVGESAAGSAIISLHEDVIEAFLQACVAVFAADWGSLGMTGEILRARMIKSLWELLSCEVRVCVHVCV